MIPKTLVRILSFLVPSLNPGTDHGLAIDDVAITFVPEPSSSQLMLFCVPALLRRRR
jgi:hypothetical protein